MLREITVRISSDEEKKNKGNKMLEEENIDARWIGINEEKIEITG